MKDLTIGKQDPEPIETASRDEIAALQLDRLKWSLRHAYDNVAMYRDRFDAAGVHPDDVTSLADLAKLPFTRKSDLRDHYPFGLFAVPRDRISRIHASSGTTGKPTVVGYTARDIGTWADLMARSLRASGVRAGQMVHNAYGYGLFTGGLAPHFQIELYRSGRMDAMRVLVEATPNAADEASRNAAARMLFKRIKDVVAVSVEIEVGDPGEVARSEGKARRVIDNRPKA